MKKTGIGVVLIVVGALVAFWSHRQLEQYEGFGEFKRRFSDTHSSRAATYETLRIAGLVGAVAGAGLAGWGLARKR